MFHDWDFVSNLLLQRYPTGLTVFVKTGNTAPIPGLFEWHAISLLAFHEGNVIIDLPLAYAFSAAGVSVNRLIACLDQIVDAVSPLLIAEAFVQCLNKDYIIISNLIIRHKNIIFALSKMNTQTDDYT